jgi:hypothetical protein
MAIERIFHCDGPDCEGHVRTASSRPVSMFLTVTAGTGRSQHFCTWDCLLKYAAQFPPTEVIPMCDD